jgi:predicted negative regulator of RcsB-dependent stress response
MKRSKMGIEKTLLEKHGKLASLIVGICVLSYGGIQYYKHYQSKEALKASVTYDSMVIAMQKQDNAVVISEAKILTEKFSKTPYAPLAALMLAKLATEENDLEGAANYLHKAMKSDEQPVQQVAKIRLARILAARQKYEEALNTLMSKKTPEAYVTLVEETKGDIYLLLNEKDKALEAYQIAIKSAPPGVPVTRIQLKQTELGVKEDS